MTYFIDRPLRSTLPLDELISHSAMDRRTHSMVVDGIEGPLPGEVRMVARMFERYRLHGEYYAARHQPIDQFTLGLRVELTKPQGLNSPLRGRTGEVVELNADGSALVRVELPQGRTLDRCLVPSECSREVSNA